MFWNDFHFDSLTAAYLTVGLLIMLLAAWYGRKTMDGRQWPKFGYAVMLFCIGYCLTILSGSTKALVIGWELMGIASFLCMIPHRNLATGNSAKAFFIYRLGDVGLLLAMWASHHLWRENTALISFLLLATASAQSSQLPLSSWLPQAMDASSAAGAMLLAALVVQMGVFLLLRSMPLWEHQLSVRILIASLGTATAALATGFARVEPSMKRRIAFASMAQVGLIFIEVAAGFKEIAMAHVGGKRTAESLPADNIARPDQYRHPETQCYKLDRNLGRPPS
ncbi:proton-conducting transporter membrane subunit [Dyadobacter sp. 676]|uniref:Proton-conducting transporter membrane subunit n=1 Tax=Dyadobacter sp. 676 TaxID=3088362 RepID=A0AAU8FN54_9BACT